ncbi:MAG: tRNA uridine-5-carboxymethylaminomethyl(34) synthesis GTPase MnmE [Verrucomicrobiota bacterium]
MVPDDTIAAIATPLGEGGLSVIRISGKNALVVADTAFVPVGKNSRKPSAAESHTIHYGKVVRAGKQVDEVLCAIMRAPRTYTREDIVEITCHGGVLSTKTVLDTVLQAGARLAEPGEFTKRAFLNGRLDLTQAEAVADLIHSRTELALSAANEQLAGKLSQRINQLRDELMNTLAHIEAHIDFPEEDIAPDTRAKLEGRLERGIVFMDEILATANEGQILRRGIRAAIVGRPNAGKSSLLNQLLGHDRAIVSPIAGTTRDTIEETANIRGLPVVFIDTAGLREARDEIETEGIRRSRESLARAEFILHVLDASEPFTAEDEQLLAEFAGKKRLLVRNKTALPQRLSAEELERRSPTRRDSENEPPPAGPETGVPIIDVSCATGQGLEALKNAIKALVWSGQVNAEMSQVTINSRHQDALRRARESTRLTLDALRADASLEFVALDLHLAVRAVGEIVGQTTTEDLLDSIFRQFCLGK